MVHTHFNDLIAQQRSDEMRRAAAQARLTRSMQAGRAAPVPTRRIARLGAALHLRRPLATDSQLD